MAQNVRIIFSPWVVLKIGTHINVLLGYGNGTSTSSRTISADANAYTVAVGDLEGDNQANLAIIYYTNNTIHILLDYDDGNFSVQTKLY